MKVLVDTSAWSMALRRKSHSQKDDKIVSWIAELIDESRVTMIGPIRQELLSGIKEKKQFKKLQKTLKPFEDIPINTCDYVKAAEMFNHCKSKGISGSHIDFLICAVSVNNHFAIFTTDVDFFHYSKYLPIQLYRSSKIGFTGS